MKKIALLILVLSLIVGSCTQQQVVKSSVEGTWKMVYLKMASNGETMPGKIQGEQIKIITKGHFTFVGHFTLDTLSQDNYGWGTYTLDGNKFTENVVLHADKASIGQTKRIFMDVSNDTLIQRYSADENWNLPETYNIEKYVRLE